MQFTFPQFIERESKIVGPLTFRQLIFFIIAGGICIFLYVFVPFGLFLTATIFLMGWAFAFAFLKIERTSLPVFIKNLFIFLSRPKIYLWKKKNILPKFFKKEPVEEVGEIEEAKEKSILKIAGKSRLKQLLTRLETKYKR